MLRDFMYLPTFSGFYFLLLPAFILFLESVRCAPVSNSSTPLPTTEPPYQSGPDTRGTMDLLWSCLATYFLCVWTAVHTDIVPFCGFWYLVFYKLIWVIYAMLAPELFLIVAVSQRRRATNIRKHWVKMFPDTLGLEGAFFLIMGGYILLDGVETKW